MIGSGFLCRINRSMCCFFLSSFSENALHCVCTKMCRKFTESLNLMSNKGQKEYKIKMRQHEREKSNTTET